MFHTLRIRRGESIIFSVGCHSPTRIELILTNPRHWKIPFGKLNVFTMSLSISMSLPRIEKERTRVDSRKMDSSLSPAIIPGRMHSWFSQVGVCISRIFCLKAGISQ
jgi:hypothetical protein